MQSDSGRAVTRGTHGLPVNTSNSSADIVTRHTVTGALPVGDSSSQTPPTLSTLPRIRCDMPILPEEVWAHLLGFVPPRDYIGLLAFSLTCEAATALVKRHFAQERPVARQMALETSLRKSLDAFRKLVGVFQDPPNFVAAATAARHVGRNAESPGVHAAPSRHDSACDIDAWDDIPPALSKAAEELCASGPALLLPVIEIPAPNRAAFLRYVFTQPQPRLIVLDLSGCLNPLKSGKAVEKVMGQELIAGTLASPARRRISLKLDCDAPNLNWLISSLAANKSLTELCIVSSPSAHTLHAQGQVPQLADLATALGANGGVKHFAIHHCLIQSEDSSALASALEVNTTLQKLDVSHNRLWGNAIKIATRQSNTSLQELRLPAVLHPLTHPISRPISASDAEVPPAPNRNVGLRINPSGDTAPVLRSFYDLNG